MKKILPTFAIMVITAIPVAAANVEDTKTSSEQLSVLEPANEVVFSQAELEQLLAPIALYPDSLLTHILISATYPLEIVQANRWRQNNLNASNEEISDAMEEKDWDPSVKALIPFTQVLERLNDDLAWTQKLGDAFLQDEALLLNSIQSLRDKAQQAGTLDDIDNLTVEHEDNNIIIRSAEPEVIYVPYYDTRVVYGNWHWAHYPPVYWDISWHHHRHHHYYVSHHGHFSWFPSVHISFNYFFNAFHWHKRHVVVFHNHHKARYNYRYHRKVISHRVKRWHHNPSHRRGVAYRTATVKHKYRSNRPAVIHSKRVRHQEKQLIASRQVSSRTQVHKSTRIHKQPAQAHKVKQTRHENIKGKLSNNTHQAKFGKTTKLSRQVSQRDIVKSNGKSYSHKQQRSVPKVNNSKRVNSTKQYNATKSSPNRSYKTVKQNSVKTKSYSSRSTNTHKASSKSTSKYKSNTRSTNSNKTKHSRKER